LAASRISTPPGAHRRGRIDAIRKGFTRYTNVDGIVELKDAIIAKFKRDNDISTSAADPGELRRQADIYHLCMAVLDPGERPLPAVADEP